MAVIKAAQMFDPVFSEAVSKLLSATDMPLAVKLSVSEFQKKVTEIGAPVNEELAKLREKYADKKTGQLDPSKSEAYSKEWTEKIGNVDLDFGNILPLNVGFDPVTRTSKLLDMFSAEELNYLDHNGVIDLKTINENMKIVELE